MADQLTDEQWQQYQRDGFLKLGKLLTDEDLAALQQRIDDIMLGTASVDYDKIMMQLDAGGNDYGKLGPQTLGHKGATLDYRKIENLEFDPLYLTYLQRPLFEDICRRVYGDSPVKCMRAMFMNKPAGRGTVLPWHQDRWTNFDRDPKVTIWTALDPATVENGCVRIIPGSHHTLVNPEHSSGFLNKEQAAALDESAAIDLVLEAGEVALLHNWTLHSSGVNNATYSRRAFSVCYMDGNTVCNPEGRTEYTTVFGDGALTVDQLGTATA